MQDGYITAGYNGLHQPIKMWGKSYFTNDWMWFGYDPLGRLVKRWKSSSGDPNTPSATFFYYDGSSLVQEGPAAGTASNIYVHGGRIDEIVASWGSGVWYNHHYDAQGSCILLSNSSGGIEQQYDYDAFGFPYFYTGSGGKAGSPKTRFLFTGREWIVDMRIYDYRARMYQPELGRFLQPDPQGFGAGDYNLYRYCHNDPVNNSDPTGLREQIAGDIIWDMARYADSANTSQGSFKDFTNGAYMGAAANGGDGGGGLGGLGGLGGGGGGRFNMAWGNKVGPNKKFGKSLDERAIKMLADETANADATQTGVVTDGPPYQVGPVIAKVDHTGRNRGSDVVLEELRFSAPKDQKDIIVHYHSYGWGKFGKPTEDHDMKMSRNPQNSPIYFTNR